MAEPTYRELRRKLDARLEKAFVAYADHQPILAVVHYAEAIGWIMALARFGMEEINEHTRR